LFKDRGSALALLELGILLVQDVDAAFALDYNAVYAPLFY
jgi:hypothetical protein